MMKQPNISAKHAIHLPGLNGLRALAALSVLWGHVFQNDFGQWGDLCGGGFSLIIDGVTMFFVISGFLITYLLLNEVERTDTVNIPKFYLRRVLRIWPIYYGYIAVSILVLYIIGNQFDIINNQLWYYLFFAANIPFLTASGIWVIVHFWSIGVEEQFYLFWPWLVKYGKKHILKIAIGVCCLWLICKYGILLSYGKCVAYRFFSVTRFDCMMIGAIGAILYYRRNKAFCNLFFNKYISLMAWVLLLTSEFYGSYIPSPVRIQYIAVLSLFVIMSQLTEKPFLINLENRLFDFVGKISYGIYVIHPILIFMFSRWYSQLGVTWPELTQRIVIYVFITLITIVLAYISYRFYEKPFLNLKRKFAVVQSSNSLDAK
jgi:peptidoglycan/LPS O-acetylase OafA/YrhL